MSTPVSQNDRLKKAPRAASWGGFVQAGDVRHRTTIGLAVPGSFEPYSSHEPARHPTSGQPIRTPADNWTLARIYFPQ